MEASGMGGLMLVVDGEGEGAEQRLRAARRAVMEGYEQAVAILSPGPGLPRHGDLAWFEAGLADARELSGLPRPRVLEDAPLDL